jgi:4-methyl-5(b-hydroxyethyl)-thiazole monophosphate biosynthesis
MAKVYVFFANGTEEIEGLTVIDLLRRAGIKVESVSIEENLEVMGSHEILIKTDRGFSDIVFDDADMLVIPGGMPGTMNLLACQELQKLINEFHQEGKMLAAICAAPIVLGASGVLKGKRATCYPGYEDRLVGASYVDQPVVCDGNIITSRGLGTAIEFSLAIIEHFCGSEKAEQIGKAIIYNQ